MQKHRVDAYFLDETDVVLASAHVSPFRGIVILLVDKTSPFRLMCGGSPLVYFLGTESAKFETRNEGPLPHLLHTNEFRETANNELFDVNR